MRLGLTATRYVGRPCKNCGETLRHKSNSTCVACTRVANTRYKRTGRGRASSVLTGLRRRGPVCTLTADEVHKILGTKKCAYCQRSLTHSAQPYNSMSTIDKLIPRLGYIPSNVVAACQQCNARKRDQSPAQLRAMATRIEQLIRRLAKGDTNR